MGIWDGAGATKSWLHSATVKKYFGVIKKSREETQILYLDDKRNAQRWQWSINLRKILMTEGYGVGTREC